MNKTKINSIFNFITLLVANVFYSNYFFDKFEKSDLTIALQGLNNFTEDLQDVGISSSFELSFFLFAIITGLLNLLFTYFFVLKINLLKDPFSFIKSFFYLFLLNFGVLSSVLYLFRFYSFPRSYLLLDIVLYPIVFILLILLTQLNAKSSMLSNYKFIKPIIYLSIISIFSVVILNQFENQNLKTSVSVSSENNIQDEISVEIPLANNEGLECAKWSGSDNYSGCKNAISLTKIKTIENNQVNNFVVLDKILFTVLKSGIILKDNEIFLDISNNVKSNASESGLYDISFHPTEPYFLVSYSNSDNDLVIDKYLHEKLEDPIYEKQLFSKPNEGQNHYCGSLDWSSFFNTFMYCVGDMGNENYSLSTTSQNGKIFLLENNDNFLPEYISESENNELRQDFVAYGLRNPWNFIEYQNYLIIPDVGEKSNEELSIINLNDLQNSLKPALFGWPIFEGSIIYEKDFYGLKFWKNNETDLYEYVLENSVKPNVFYDRPAPENNRAAILGTLVFQNSESILHEHVLFADFLSKEVFAYDYKTDKLYIINLPYFPGYLTSISKHPNDSDKILFSTSNEGSSEVYELQLP